MKVLVADPERIKLTFKKREALILRNCADEAIHGSTRDRFIPSHKELRKFIESLDGNAHTKSVTLDHPREIWLTVKNILYECYVELGEWEFTRKIGLPPAEASDAQGNQFSPEANRMSLHDTPRNFPPSQYQVGYKSAQSLNHLLAVIILVCLGLTAAALFANPYC
jgi:hypothetical protein